MRTLSLRTHHKDRYRGVLPRLRLHIYYATVQIPKRILGQKRKTAKATIVKSQGQPLNVFQGDEDQPRLYKHVHREAISFAVCAVYAVLPWLGKESWTNLTKSI